MYQFKKHEIKIENNELVISLYLDLPNEEFAEELNSKNKEEQVDLEKSAKSYISSKMPNLKNATVKVMAGSLLIASLAFGLPERSPAAAEAAIFEFNDIEGKYYTDPVNVLYEKGILKGYGDGTFAPDRDVTRAEAAAMLARSLNLDTERTVGEPVFDDVEGGWYYGVIAALKEEGIIKGYEDNTFKPNQEITRAEIAKMIVSAYNHLEKNPDADLPFTDVTDGDWFKEYIAAINESEITKGISDTEFAPRENTSRAEASTFIYRSMNVDLFGSTDGKAPIEGISNSTVTINGNEFPLSDDAKGLLNENNQDILSNAVIYALTDRDNVVQKIRYLEITNSGEDKATEQDPLNGHLQLDGENTIIDGPLIISGDYLALNNVTINNDLIVGDELENSLSLNNVTINGETIFKGIRTDASIAESATNDAGLRVTVENSALGDVIINKSNLRFDSKESSFTRLTANTNAVFNGDDNTVVPEFFINEGASEVELNGNIANLEVNTSKPVNLVGKARVTNLRVVNEGALTLGIEGNVEKVEFTNKDSRVTINEMTSIDNIALPEGSEAKNAITNFDEAKKRIQKINDTANPDAEPVNEDVIEIPEDATSAGIGEIYDVNEQFWGVSIAEGFAPTDAEPILWQRTDGSIVEVPHDGTNQLYLNKTEETDGTVNVYYNVDGAWYVISATYVSGELVKVNNDDVTDVTLAPTTAGTGEVTDVNEQYWGVTIAEDFAPTDAEPILWQRTDGSIVEVPHDGTNQLYLNKTEETDGTVNVYYNVDGTWYVISATYQDGKLTAINGNDVTNVTDPLVAPEDPAAAAIGEVTEANERLWGVTITEGFAPTDAEQILWQRTDGSIVEVPHDGTNQLYLNKTEETDGTVNVYYNVDGNWYVISATYQDGKLTAINGNDVTNVTDPLVAPGNATTAAIGEVTDVNEQLWGVTITEGFAPTDAETILWQRTDGSIVEVPHDGTNKLYLNKVEETDGTVNVYYNVDGDWYVISATYVSGELVKVNNDGVTDVTLTPTTAAIGEVTDVNEQYWGVTIAEDFAPTDAEPILWQGTDGSIVEVPHDGTNKLYLNKTEDTDGSVNVYYNVDGAWYVISASYENGNLTAINGEELT
ncbi:S-layer homology domain-containing protein [Desertibacillus haloalkaliphilus]|uniref:S-layer homology domain-containing protein n=1 Tax=Desertibacillus haloalkaliphilus TaxID=1328930 RepID=UPI001C278B94|nr:S-layer homology domain-containing protein [Desertibacillus haloalkaliphilus]MBU8906041.1 S-layer homology domain-containing protein [Desertibacillus haloalkaliphilus]